VPDNRPIGVFDSGVGGLTVARAILDLLPHEPLIYVGDTARFPYGARPPEQIRGFAVEIARSLVERDVKMLVVACNSVEVSAIDAVAVAAGLPVIGVIDPGARAAVRATRNRRIGLIGTEATVASGAYERAVGEADPEVRLTSAACPAFVEHVERGDTSSPELRAAAERYLGPLRRQGVDTLILGCTHYPLLGGLLRLEMGPEVVLVSSAEETANDVYGTLVVAGLERDAGAARSRHEFLCTGQPAAFQAVAEPFLAPEIAEVRAARLELDGGRVADESRAARGSRWS
jgi:glutamate racemase